jgi:hypothetical protein
VELWRGDVLVGASDRRQLQRGDERSLWHAEQRVSVVDLQLQHLQELQQRLLEQELLELRGRRRRQRRLDREPMPVKIVQRIPVRLAISEAQLDGMILRAGMSAAVEIDTGKQNSILGRWQGGAEPTARVAQSR